MYIAQIVDFDSEPILDVSIELVNKTKLNISDVYTESYLADYSTEHNGYLFEPVAPGRYCLNVSKKGYKDETVFISVTQTGFHQKIVLEKKGTKSKKYLIAGNTKHPVIEREYLSVVIDSLNSPKQVIKKIEQLDKKNKGKTPKLILTERLDAAQVNHTLLNTDNLNKSELKRLKKKLKKEKSVQTFTRTFEDSENNIIEVTPIIHIKFFDEVTPEEIDAFLNRDEVDLISQSNYESNTFLIKYENADDEDIFEYASELLKEGLFEIFEPQINVADSDLAITPPDFLFPEQWHIPLVNLPNAWERLKSQHVDLTYGSADIVLSIHDAGVQSNTVGGVTNALLADFSGNVKGGELSTIVQNNRKSYSFYDFRHRGAGGAGFSVMVPNNNTVRPIPPANPSSHGLGCAGVALGSAGGTDGIIGNQGIVGAAPNVRLLAAIWQNVRTTTLVYNQARLWMAGLYPNWRADGANYANGAPGMQVFPPQFKSPGNPGWGASVMSHSRGWGGAMAAGSLTDNSIHAVTAHGRNKRGTLLLFAAGNGDSVNTGILVIGQHEKTFTVAASALDINGQESRASYSSWGTGQLNGIDFCAPGHYFYVGTPPAIFSPSGIEHQPPQNYGILSGVLRNAAGQGQGNLPITNTSQSTLVNIVNPTTIQIAAGGGAFVAGNAILINAGAANAEGARINAVNAAGTTLTLSHPLKQVHVAAPVGGSPVAAGQADARDTFGGTSAAAPIASGVAALVLSANPNLTYLEVRSIMQLTAQPIDFRLSRVVGPQALGWISTTGVPILDANDLMVVNGAPAANTNVVGNFPAGRTDIQLASVANLSVGQVILFGAETRLTANALMSAALTVQSTANFAPNMNIIVGAGPSAILSRPIAAGANVILVSNTRGFFANQAITIGTGANQENHTILQIGNGAGQATSTMIVLNANLANGHNKYDPVVLTNIEPAQIQPGAIVAGTLNLNANLVNNHTIGGANPRVWVRSTNCEIRIIKSIDTVNNRIKIDPLQFNQNNSPVTGGLIPQYSNALGFGRVDADEAVKMAQNYDFNLRDLVVRNSLTDLGKTATDVNSEIDSPDIWIRNNAPGAPPFAPPNIPANYQTHGNTAHQKPRRGGARWIYTRIGNMGTQGSLDYSVYTYVSLIDSEVEDKITVHDYMQGPTRPWANPASPTNAQTPYSLPLNIPGTFLVGTQQSRVQTLANYLPQVLSGGNRIFQSQWPQAAVPSLPLTYASVMLMNTVSNGATTIQVNHTRGFKVGQTILVGTPTTLNQFSAVVASFTDQVITLNAPVAGLGAMIPTGIQVIRLAANPTTIKTGIPAPINTIDVADAATFTPGDYVLVGPPGNATSEIKRITAITYNNGGDDTITVDSNVANARVATENVSRIEGKLKTFVLAEVTPHDGLLAGKTPYDNNNMSCKEIFLGHKISFLDNSDNKLGDQVQVSGNGSDFTVNFRVRVEDPENFNTEQVQITVYRTATNGNVDTATYVYTNPGGPWTLTGGGTWLVLNQPVLTAANTAGAVAATLVQQDIWFLGSFKVKSSHSQLRIVVSAPDTGGTFTSIEAYSTKVVTANAPTGSAAEIQSKSGQPKLGGTQRMFCFADMTNLNQTADQAFGPIDTNRFRLTSMFSTAAATNVMAYAVLDGLVFVQENPANNTFNLIIRPFKQAEITYTKVKYFIYRGLRRTDIVDGATPANARADGGNPKGNFIDNLHKTNTELNPGNPLTLVSLDWDKKAKEGFLDDYFFSSDPNAQLPVVKRGMELGRFHNLLPADEFGFEIVLAEGDYSLTIENAQASATIIDVSSVSNADEKKWKREQILNYVDPAAYFGLHYYGKLLYPTIPDPDPNAINSVTHEKAAIYTNVVSKFFTRNTLYIDIRNEHGYSYNYDETYTLTDGSTEDGNHLRMGLTPSGQSSPPVAKKYGFMEWPIMVYNNTATPVQTSEDTNSIYFNLGWNINNSDPQIYVERGFVLTGSSQNRFISRSYLMDLKAVVNIDTGTSVIRVAGDITADLNPADYFSINDNSIGVANKVYRVLLIALNGVNTDITVEAGTIPVGADLAKRKGRIAFGKWTKDVGLSFPNQPDATTPTHRRNVAGVLKMRYFTRINPNVRTISGLNQGAKQFTVLGNVTGLLKSGDKFSVRKTVPIAGNHNDGEYTVAPGVGSLTLVGANTQITVVEAIPAAGPANGEVLLTDQKKIKTSRYFDNIFGSLGALTRRLPISSMAIVSPTVTNITIIGNFVSTIQQNARLNIVGANIPGNNINGATINATALNPDGNTVVTIQHGAGATVADTTGFIQIFYSIWNTTEPTRWITGFDRRFIDAKKDPADLLGTPLVGFSYVAQTGIALETDNVIFYATPMDYFEPPTAGRVPNSISMNGGTSTDTSFWKVMQTQNQRLKVITTILKIGADEIPVYDFEDYPGDSDHDKMKENFFALCITKVEMESLIVAANQTFTDFHQNYLVLRNEIIDTDDNLQFYRRYEVHVNGWALINGKMVEREIAPAAPVYVYTLEDDSLVFTSKNYPNLGSLLSENKTFYEEELRLKTDALSILGSNAAVQTIVNDFEVAMNAITNDYTAIKAAMLHADLLWATAVGVPATQDDRPYYWARLHMRVIIRNHPYLKTQRRRMYEILTLLQDKSRGISSIDYSAAGGLDKKILIIAFDPYGLDKLEDPAYNIKMSNPGAVAAHELHDQSINNGVVTGYIQSVVFPVRYRTQQRGDLEKMVLPLLTGADAVDMIVTVSPNRAGRYDIERFAARYRNSEIKDNNNQKGTGVTYYYAKPDNTVALPFRILRTSTVKRAKFIESNLPETNLIPGTLGNNLVIYNQQYTTSDPAVTQGLSATGSGTADVPFPSSTPDPKSGSAGAYLFNEAFYRIGSIRTDVASTTKTGHISVDRFQGSTDDFDLAKSQTVSNNLKQLLIDALLGL